ncbi:hypothetical protein BGX38DRAFT_772334 [Terfezia claveryi]|nr:hypothetical protein BGX38DRAFT_772334 [Terfezia claveryi]
MVLKPDLVQRPRNQLLAQKKLFKLRAIQHRLEHENKMPTGETSKNGESRLQPHRKKREKWQFTGDETLLSAFATPAALIAAKGMRIFFRDDTADTCCLGTYIVFSSGECAARREIGEDVDAVDGGRWTHPVALLTQNRRPWHSTADVRDLAPRPRATAAPLWAARYAANLEFSHAAAEHNPPSMPRWGVWWPPAPGCLRTQRLPRGEAAPAR